MFGINYWDEPDEPYETERQELFTPEEPDPLAALVHNAELMEELKEDKRLLMIEAVKAGYNNRQIGARLDQSESAVRMYRRRHGAI